MSLKTCSPVLPASDDGSAESMMQQLWCLLPSRAVYPRDQHSAPGCWPCVVPFAHGAQRGSFPWTGSIISWLPELLSDHLLSVLLMAWNLDHFSVASLPLWACLGVSPFSSISELSPKPNTSCQACLTPGHQIKILRALSGLLLIKEVTSQRSAHSYDRNMWP